MEPAQRLDGRWVNPSRFWTEEENELLLELKERGKSYEYLSVVFGRTVMACQRHFQECRFEIERQDPNVQFRGRVKRWKMEEDRLLLQLKESDRSWEEIADTFPRRNIAACKRRYRILIRNRDEAEHEARVEEDDEEYDEEEDEAYDEEQEEEEEGCNEEVDQECDDEVKIKSEDDEEVEIKKEHDEEELFRNL
ncbi:hypothetical protein E4U17_004219 [Claviceps sp. LM77 group G4]|nr:hypothetical protein E4U17_004219 [Claviceps sp. LM77 group G4]KAG6070308.1 hypothetical protein E4U33_004255 [Claviceps sp. LM78 group G4]KAG6083696.1 hypothetical protein E4U16_003562 [Claviceps sp. LM84 group G4]